MVQALLDGFAVAGAGAEADAEPRRRRGRLHRHGDVRAEALEALEAREALAHAKLTLVQAILDGFAVACSTTYGSHM